MEDQLRAAGLAGFNIGLITAVALVRKWARENDLNEEARASLTDLLNRVEVGAVEEPTGALRS